MYISQERHAEGARLPVFSAPEQHFPCKGGERGGGVGGLVLPVRVSDLMQNVVYSLRVAVARTHLRVRRRIHVMQNVVYSLRVSVTRILCGCVLLIMAPYIYIYVYIYTYTIYVYYINVCVCVCVYVCIVSCLCR